MLVTRWPFLSTTVVWATTRRVSEWKTGCSCAHTTAATSAIRTTAARRRPTLPDGRGSDWGGALWERIGAAHWGWIESETDADGARLRPRSGWGLLSGRIVALFPER